MGIDKNFNFEFWLHIDMVAILFVNKIYKCVQTTVF